MKVGLIATGKGSALLSAIQVSALIDPHLEFYGFSDRSCPAYERMIKYYKSTYLLDSKDNKEISRQAYDFFSRNSCERVYLLYSRLITSDLYNNIPCYNVHPSILPNFRGFNAVSNAFASKSKELGVTIHKVDATVDAGEIVSCIKTFPSINTIDYWHSISYLMKTIVLSASILTKAPLDNCNRVEGQFKDHLIEFKKSIPESFLVSNCSVDNNLVFRLNEIVKDSHCSQYHHPLNPQQIKTF